MKTQGKKSKKDKLFVISCAKSAPVASAEKPKDHKYAPISVTCKAPKSKSSGAIKQPSGQPMSQVWSLQTLLNGLCLPQTAQQRSL